jgi:hypothetical protein
VSRVFTQVVGPGAMGCGCRIAATELTAREAVLFVRPGDVSGAGPGRSAARYLCVLEQEL